METLESVRVKFRSKVWRPRLRTHWMRLNETFKREVEKRKGAKD